MTFRARPWLLLPLVLLACRGAEPGGQTNADSTAAAAEDPSVDVAVVDGAPALTLDPGMGLSADVGAAMYGMDGTVHSYSATVVRGADTTRVTVDSAAAAGEPSVLAASVLFGRSGGLRVPDADSMTTETVSDEQGYEAVSHQTFVRGGSRWVARFSDHQRDAAGRLTAYRIRIDPAAP
jgi:hypothetical protein